MVTHTFLYGKKKSHSEKMDAVFFFLTLPLFFFESSRINITIFTFFTFLLIQISEVQPFCYLISHSHTSVSALQMPLPPINRIDRGCDISNRLQVRVAHRLGNLILQRIVLQRPEHTLLNPDLVPFLFCP